MKRKAMTLIELVIYLSITMVVLVVVLDLVVRLGQTKAASAGQTEVVETARFINNRFLENVKSASKVALDQGSLTLTIEGGEVSFLLEGNTLYRQMGVEKLALSSHNIEILPADGQETIFFIADNGAQRSVELRYKVSNIQNGLTKEYSIAGVPRGVGL